jgi:retinol dehydrogenase-11
MIVLIFVLLFTVCVATKIYFKLITGWCKSQTCLKGKTALVTGPTSGIGYYTALDFAKRGARVILGCLNQTEGEWTRSRIIGETGNENVEVKLIDLNSFDSIRAFAKEINDTEERLDILVNNAGVIGFGNRRTKDDCLYVMQVNYFGPFLLTHLLIELLKKSKGSRIVNVSSLVAATVYDLDVTKLNTYPGYDHKLYARSKFCVQLFTIELAKKLRSTNITTYSVHPGVVRTNLFENVYGLGKIIILLGLFFFKTSEEGAQTTIHCAVSRGIEKLSGEHFVDCNKVSPYKSTTNLELSRKLWKVTTEIVQLKSEEILL